MGNLNKENHFENCKGDYQVLQVHFHPELNAVLQQYNVIAERGKDGTITHKKNGLVYSMVDEKGSKVGVPIKASSIYGNPTCTLCIASAVVSVVMIGPAMDEVLASLQYLKRAKNSKISMWKAFWGYKGVYEIVK